MGMALCREACPMHVSFISDGLHVFVTLGIYQRTENSRKWPYRKATAWRINTWHVNGLNRGD